MFYFFSLFFFSFFSFICYLYPYHSKTRDKTRVSILGLPFSTSGPVMGTGFSGGTVLSERSLHCEAQIRAVMIMYSDCSVFHSYPLGLSSAFKMA